jgi:hypothetical protein
LDAEAAARAAADTQLQQNIDANAGLSGYEIVEFSSPYNTNAQKSAQAQCPSGKKVIGGGAAYSDQENGLASSQGHTIAIQWSRPFANSSQSGYTALADDMSQNHPSLFSWRIIAYAICADGTSP